MFGQPVSGLAIMDYVYQWSFEAMKLFQAIARSTNSSVELPLGDLNLLNWSNFYQIRDQKGDVNHIQ